MTSLFIKSNNLLQFREREKNKYNFKPMPVDGVNPRWILARLTTPSCSSFFPCSPFLFSILFPYSPTLDMSKYHSRKVVFDLKKKLFISVDRWKPEKMKNKVRNCKKPLNCFWRQDTSGPVLRACLHLIRYEYFRACIKGLFSFDKVWVLHGPY